MHMYKIYLKYRLCEYNNKKNKYKNMIYFESF